MRKIAYCERRRELESIGGHRAEAQIVENFGHRLSEIEVCKRFDGARRFASC